MYAVYSEWVFQILKVEIVTDFVHKCQQDAYAGKTKGVYIAKGKTPYTAMLSIPLDASPTFQCLQEIESLQKLVFFYQLLPEQDDDQKLLLLCPWTLGEAASSSGLRI